MASLRALVLYIFDNTSYIKVFPLYICLISSLGTWQVDGTKICPCPLLKDLPVTNNCHFHRSDCQQCYEDIMGIGLARCLSQ